jgi:hypothetical protein
MLSMKRIQQYEVVNLLELGHDTADITIILFVRVPYTAACPPVSSTSLHLPIDMDDHDH